MDDGDPQARWYQRHMDLRGQVIADVGANVGRLSRFFLDHGDASTRVVSIEPVPHNVEVLRGKARTDPRWRVEACAASDAEGTVWLDVFHTAEEGWNSVVRQRGADRMAVPCRPLAAIVPDATIVKIDVEGHEYAIMDAALPAMAAVHTWALELHMVRDRPLPALLAALERHGFHMIAAARKPGDASGNWYDVTIPASLDWTAIPLAKQRSDGHPDGPEFKMLHVLARRQDVAR